MFGTSFTGIGRYCHELVRNLAKYDKKNEYVLFFNAPEYERFVPSVANFRKVLVNAKHYSYAEQSVFYRKIKAEKVDLMHFTHFNAPLLYGGESVVTIHDLTLSYFPGKKMRGLFQRAAYQAVLRQTVRQARKVIAVSQNTKNDLVKLLAVPPQKIQVVYEGVAEEIGPIKDETRLAEVRKRYALPADFLLYTGVWRSHKNLLGLLDAFLILKERYAYGGGLVLTGRPDPLYPEVMAKINASEIKNSIFLTGLVPEADLVAFLNLATVFVFPSYYEGFGLPPLEAFACSTPVACSNSSCLPEICGIENAAFFNPHDPADMAAKIQRILTDSTWRGRLVAGGLARVKFFSWEKMAKETLAIYNDRN